MKVTTGVLVSILALAALASGAAVSAQAQDDLRGTAWQLVSLGGTDVIEGTTITLSFDNEGRVSGSAGCNSYGATYTAAEGVLSVEMPFSTLMACMEPGVMEQEQAYLAALEAAARYTIADHQLVITGAEGVQLVFAPLLTLAGTGWQLITLGQNDVLGEVTLLFGEDGRVTGTGGCNTFRTTYRVEGDALGFGPVLSTRMACPDAASSQQEIDYFAALEAAAAFDLTAEQLIISGEGATLVFAAQPTLPGTQWVLAALDGRAVVAEMPVTLEFGASGEAHGYTGCNTFRTTFRVEGDALTFDGRIVTTRRACMDAAAGAQERAYLDALAGASAYTLEGDQLTITYGEGGQLRFVQVVE